MQIMGYFVATASMKNKEKHFCRMVDWSGASVTPGDLASQRRPWSEHSGSSDATWKGRRGTEINLSPCLKVFSLLLA